ncbi:MAG: DUF6538 domain-containing protein [Desulfobacterales bacterium]
MQKITRSPSYLIRNAHSYCFRLVVPLDLQPYICKKELRWSLRTGYLSDAKQKARAMAVEVQALFQSVREMVVMGDLTDIEIKKLVNGHFQNLTGDKSFECCSWEGGQALTKPERDTSIAIEG